jgi:hypothetical protein
VLDGYQRVFATVRFGEPWLGLWPLSTRGERWHLVVGSCKTACGELLSAKVALGPSRPLREFAGNGAALDALLAALPTKLFCGVTLTDQGHWR